jgi:hypothetical protein
MTKFDLSQYQTVKERKDLFHKDHGQGVVLPVLVTDPKTIGEEAAFAVGVFHDRETLERGADRLAQAHNMDAFIDPYVALLIMAPDAIGTAYENKGMTGASKTSWTENAEESAIGRALDNVGYHGNGKCSREEILKVKEIESLPEEDPTTGNVLTNYPRLDILIEGLTGKKGVKELRQVAAHAAMLEWDEEELFNWADTQGVSLNNAPQYTDAVKLRDAIKGLRNVGVVSEG